MIVSLDFDETYTCDPAGWDEIITLLKSRGHTVYCVTMRYDTGTEAAEVRAALADKVDAIYFTCRKGKRDFMYDKRIHINVWIDDNPFFIIASASS